MFISFGTGNHSIGNRDKYVDQARESGAFSLDVSSMKLHHDCSKPTELTIDTYQIKDYFNMSLKGPVSDQPTLVVAYM